MLQHAIKLLCTTAASLKALPSYSIQFERLTAENENSDIRGQKEYLEQLIKEHHKLVKRIATLKDSVHSTYDENKCLFFEEYGLATLPATNGVHRKELRKQLSNSDVISEVRKNIIKPWQRPNSRHVLIYGCTSIPYLERLLQEENAEHDNYSFLVIDKSLEKLANASFHLNRLSAFNESSSMFASVSNDEDVDKTCSAIVNTAATFSGSSNLHNATVGATENNTVNKERRIFYLRSDVMFANLEVFEPETVDTVIVPMPSPVYSMSGSYKRLVTCDFYCSVNRLLRVRESNSDDRGIVIFTDCEPYASFMMEQLEEAKLIVPFVRKNAMETYFKWLPTSMKKHSSNEQETTEHSASVTSVHENNLVTFSDSNKNKKLRKEFPQQRFETLIAIAASKRASVSPQAEQLILDYDYKRKYYSSIPMPHIDCEKGEEEKREQQRTQQLEGSVQHSNLKRYNCKIPLKENN